MSLRFGRSRHIDPVGPGAWSDAKCRAVRWILNAPVVIVARASDTLFIYAVAVALTGCATANHNAMLKPKQTAQVLDKTISKRFKVNYLLFLPQGYEEPGAHWPLL